MGGSRSCPRRSCGGRGGMTDDSREWVTLQEAADMLGLCSREDLARELNLASNAVLFADDMRDGGPDGRIPVRMVPGCDYLFSATLGSGRAVHAVSHLLREAVFPWAAERAAALLRTRPWSCPDHGELGAESVLHHSWRTASSLNAPADKPLCGVVLPVSKHRCLRELRALQTELAGEHLSCAESRVDRSR